VSVASGASETSANAKADAEAKATEQAREIAELKAQLAAMHARQAPPLDLTIGTTKATGAQGAAAVAVAIHSSAATAPTQAHATSVNEAAMADGKRHAPFVTAGREAAGLDPVDVATEEPTAAPTASLAAARVDTGAVQSMADSKAEGEAAALPQDLMTPTAEEKAEERKEKPALPRSMRGASAKGGSSTEIAAKDGEVLADEIPASAAAAP